MARLLRNPNAERTAWASLPSRAPHQFHAGFADYAATPLHAIENPSYARGIGTLLVKDESRRLGLPAFKILGASWAIARALQERFGLPPGETCSLDTLRGQVAARGSLRLVAATDGNHGRGVARVARLLGATAHVFMPRGTAPSRIEAIASEGATVTIVPGTYDETIDAAMGAAVNGALLVQDHAWPGYERIPTWVAEGYATIFWEIEEQRAEHHLPAPDIVLVQIGVGALAAAVVQHYRSPAIATPPVLVGVEPVRAACALAACEAGGIVSVPAGAEDSIMAGLNCGTVSSAAWPMMRRGIDAFLTVEDDRAREAMRALAMAGIVSGESGAAGLAGLLELLHNEDMRPFCEKCNLNGDATALVISTEGATDAEAFRRIVGQEPLAVAARRGHGDQPVRETV